MIRTYGWTRGFWGAVKSNGTTVRKRKQCQPRPNKYLTG